METIIVYLDDADYARAILAPMTGERERNAQAEHTHWVLVACAPRMTRHVSKWVNRTARENWNARWCDKAFEAITPMLRERGDRITTVQARGVLVEQTRSLVTRYGAGHVLDARRPKFGQQLAPVTAGQPARPDARWEVPGAVAGLGAVLLLAAD